MDSQTNKQTIKHMDMRQKNRHMDMRQKTDIWTRDKKQTHG